MVATVLAAAAIGANAEEFALKPAQKGMEINLPVTILKSFPNDKASITLSYIEWSASRTGLINPVAVFEIGRASCRERV